MIPKQKQTITTSMTRTNTCDFVARFLKLLIKRREDRDGRIFFHCSWLSMKTIKTEKI